MNEITVRAWFKKYSYNQINVGVAYTLNEYKNGKVKDVAKYLQKMVSTPALTIQLDNQSADTKMKKKKEEEIKNNVENEIQHEELKNKLRKEYFEKKINLSIEILKTNKNSYIEFLQQLKEESQDGKFGLLPELAIKNYKSVTAYPESSLDEFLYNFNEGGIFQSYIIEKMSTLFEEFKNLKAQYLPKAMSIGLKENEIF